MMRPLGLRGDFKHGTRASYVVGCRCEDCRRANREYARERTRALIYGDYNNLVSAGEAREHLLKLRDAGVGRRTVADITGIAQSSLSAILGGQKARIRARSARAILAVTAEAALNDQTPVDAGELLDRLEALRLARGWTCKELARRMGYRGNALQFDRVLTARNVRRIERFLAQPDAGGNVAEDPGNVAGDPETPALTPQGVLRVVAAALELDPDRSMAALIQLALPRGLPLDPDRFALAASIRAHVNGRR